jgi:hypothetical protein
MAYTTTFPDWVRHQVGARWVLVAKNAMDFEWYKPDMVGVDEHVKWFHNFWWENIGGTKTHLTAFYDTKEAAIEAGVQLAMGRNGHLYNWAVYGSTGVLVDGKY